MTIDEALAAGTAQVGRRLAMLLLCNALDKDSAYVMLHGEKLVENFDTYQLMLNQVEGGHPVQYVLGTWGFMQHKLTVDDRALIPRPETELLVEAVLSHGIQGKKVLDMCTGSGCIAISLAASARCCVTATDISTSALELAQHNGAGFNIRFIHSNLFENVEGMFDIIVSNPPYITTAEMQQLDPVVRNYEPHLALHGGADGMDIYRKLIPQAFSRLHPGGMLFVEIGPRNVEDIFVQAGFRDIVVQQDYAGLDRIIYGVR